MSAVSGYSAGTGSESVPTGDSPFAGSGLRRSGPAVATSRSMPSATDCSAMAYRSSAASSPMTTTRPSPVAVRSAAIGSVTPSRAAARSTSATGPAVSPAPRAARASRWTSTAGPRLGSSRPRPIVRANRSAWASSASPGLSNDQGSSRSADAVAGPNSSRRPRASRAGRFAPTSSSTALYSGAASVNVSHSRRARAGVTPSTAASRLGSTSAGSRTPAAGRREAVVRPRPVHSPVPQNAAKTSAASAAGTPASWDAPSKPGVGSD